ncbi:hypothetical protein HYV31_03275 [candidate division WWE3 bacterium]|nr:hypothetical protein [candidate division WWE3 bacterium]
MSNQKKLSGAKGLPFIILGGVILIAGYFLVGKDFINNLSLFEKTKTLEMQRLEGFPAKISVANPDIEKQRKVITNEKELIDFLAFVDKTSSLTVGEKIDFSKQMLIGVSSETFDNDEFEVKIRKIYLDKEKNKLLVSVKIMQPGDSCAKLQQPGVGVDVVVVDKTDMRIDFETLRETQICKE